MIYPDRKFDIPYLILKDYKPVYKFYQKYPYRDRADFLDLIEWIVSKSSDEHKAMLVKVKEEVDQEEQLKKKQEETVNNLAGTGQTDFLETLTFYDQYDLVNSQHDKAAISEKNEGYCGPIPPLFVNLSQFIFTFDPFSITAAYRIIKKDDYVDHVAIYKGNYYVNPEHFLKHASVHGAGNTVRLSSKKMLRDKSKMEEIYKMMGKT